jgi:hypothetical protein
MYISSFGSGGDDGIGLHADRKLQFRPDEFAV